MSLDTSLSGYQEPFSPRVATPVRKRGDLVNAIMIQVMIMGALVLGFYAPAADWFSARTHNSEISGYVDAVEASDPETLKRALELAYAYNDHMPQGPLRDPYTSTVDPDGDAAALRAYEDLLRVSPSDSIGHITYNDTNISLPIYHGTSDRVLRKGVGHLYGSSLPVGGPSTHSVLTSHSGLVNASLFTSLTKAKLGDVFSVQVLGETHWYKVDDIRTVLPDETDALRIVDNADYVTLITCVPVSVNTHRLLVRGTRIPAPQNEYDGTVAGDGVTAGFPWWAAAVLGGSAASAWFLFIYPRHTRKMHSVKELAGMP
ncbi:class C sortase [Leucobacter sp. HY1910]